MKIHFKRTEDNNGYRSGRSPPKFFLLPARLLFSLAKQLLQHKFSKKKIGDLLVFLQLYVRFANPAYNLNLAYRQEGLTKQIEVITKNKRTMGIREMVLERAKKEGLEKGLETGLKTGLRKGRLKGREEGLEEGIQNGKAEVVSNLLLKMGMTQSLLFFPYYHHNISHTDL